MSLCLLVRDSTFGSFYLVCCGMYFNVILIRHTMDFIFVMFISIEKNQQTNVSDV